MSTQSLRHGAARRVSVSVTVPATQVGGLVTVTARRASHSVIRAAERTIRAFQHAGQKLRTIEREADLKGSYHLLLQETTP